MPDPAKYDTEEEFMDACVPAVLDEGKPRKQAVAQCLNMWRDRNKEEMEAAHSTLLIKAFDEEQRIIEGIASTPQTDGVGDIMDPLGAKFSVPMPLLWHHKRDMPVGHVVQANANSAGITIRAKIAKIDEPGELKNFVDRAWQSVKAGLVRGLSVGFRPLEAEFIDNSPRGGRLFKAWSWLELSLVTIPANSAATISIVKSYDHGLPAASGTTETGSHPGVSGKVGVTLTARERSMSKTVAEQISALEATRAAKAAKMSEIMQKSADEGRSTHLDEQEEFDTLKSEVTQIDGDLSRYRELEKMNVAKAAPLPAPTEIRTPEDGAAARQGYIRVRSPELPKGIRMARVIKCLGLAQGNKAEAAQIAEQSYPDDQGIVNIFKAAIRHGELADWVVKAPVAAGTTQHATWAGPLVGDETGVFADFLEFLRPETILGKFGTNGIPALRSVPFRVPLLSQTSGGAGYWVGESKAKPLTAFSFARTTMEPLKVANICVLTMEVLRDSNPSAETLVRDGLVAALRERLDTDFINPAKAAVAGISPASITNGITAIPASGVTADAVYDDINKVLVKFLDADNPPKSGVWIMPSTTASRLSMMRGALGQLEFPTINVSGGTLQGMPVITSEYVPSVGSPVSATVVLLNASDIYLADEGGFNLDLSREASLEMSDAPTQTGGGIGSPGTPVATSMVSLFQNNLVGFRAERTVNWMRARPSAVAVLSGVAWGT